MGCGCTQKKEDFKSKLAKEKAKSVTPATSSPVTASLPLTTKTELVNAVNPRQTRYALRLEKIRQRTERIKRREIRIKRRIARENDRLAKLNQSTTTQINQSPQNPQAPQNPQ